MGYRFHQYDPCPLDKSTPLDTSSTERAVLAMQIQNKYCFFDSSGNAVYEYLLPEDHQIFNCAGYFGKIAAYRDPDLRAHFEQHGVVAEALTSDKFPILNTQSPKLDYLILQFINELRRARPQERVSILDMGCTLAEHYDFLDLILKSQSSDRQSAASVLHYVGIDNYPLHLVYASLLHKGLDKRFFRLHLTDGACFDNSDSYDISLSVGVVNHVSDPQRCLRQMLKCTSHACLLQLWITSEPVGRWIFNHSGIPFYLFSARDLFQMADEAGSRLLIGEFEPQAHNSQIKSFVGVDSEAIDRIGSAQIAFCKNDHLPQDLSSRLQPIVNIDV